MSKTVNKVVLPTPQWEVLTFIQRMQDEVPLVAMNKTVVNALVKKGLVLIVADKVKLTQAGKDY